MHGTLFLLKALSAESEGFTTLLQIAAPVTAVSQCTTHLSGPATKQHACGTLTAGPCVQKWMSPLQQRQPLALLAAASSCSSSQVCLAGAAIAAPLPKGVRVSFPALLLLEQSWWQQASLAATTVAAPPLLWARGSEVACPLCCHSLCHEGGSSQLAPAACLHKSLGVTASLVPVAKKEFDGSLSHQERSPALGNPAAGVAPLRMAPPLPTCPQKRWTPVAFMVTLDTAFLFPLMPATCQVEEVRSGLAFWPCRTGAK